MAKLKDILFPVEKVNFHDQFGMVANSDYSHAIIGTIGSGKKAVRKVLNVCSDRYELIPNAEIFPAIRAILSANNVKFTENYRMVNNARFYAEFNIEGHDVNMGGGDIIKPTLRVNHSYNGLTKYSMTFGYFRMICSNGLTIPLEGHEEKNLHIVGKHTAAIQTSLDSLVERIENFFKLNKEVVKRMEVLTDRSIENWSERLEAVIEATKQKPSKAQFAFISETIKKEQAQLNLPNVTDWLIYNGVNAYIFNDEFNKAAQEVRQETDKKLLTHMLVNA